MAETIIFQSLPPRPAPVKTEGLVPWIRTNLFGSWQSTLTTLIVGGLLLYFLPKFLNWAMASVPAGV
jgi:general L-amino acid transport system permease protein